MQWNFLLHKLRTSKFIATTHINYCNYFDVIAMIFCCYNKHFFLVVLFQIQNKIKEKTFQKWNHIEKASFKWGNPLQYFNGQSTIHWLHRTPFLSVSSINMRKQQMEETERKGVRCSQWMPDCSFKYWSGFPHLNVSFFNVVSFLECFIFDFVLYLECFIFNFFFFL